MSEQKKKPNIRGIELLVIKDMPSRGEAGSGCRIRVVQWVYPPKRVGEPEAFTVALEKRDYYTKAGKVLPGKARGFTLDDLSFLHPKWKEMIALMKNPPKPPAAPAPASRPQDDTIEEVPF